MDPTEAWFGSRGLAGGVKQGLAGGGAAQRLVAGGGGRGREVLRLRGRLHLLLYRLDHLEQVQEVLPARGERSTSRPRAARGDQEGMLGSSAAGAPGARC